MLEPFEDHHGLLHRRLCCAIASSPLAAWFVMAVDLDNHLLEVDECSLRTEVYVNMERWELKSSGCLFLFGDVP